MRTVEVPDSQAGDPPTVKPSVSPAGLAVGGTIGSNAIAGPEVTKSAPPAPVVEAPATASPAPAPANRAPLNPFGKAQSPGDPASLLGGAPSRLANPLSSSPAPGTLGGLRATSPENLGPINFSGPSASLTDTRSSSAFSSAPVDRPTIPIRRPAPKQPEAVAESAPAPAPAPAPPVHRVNVTIEAWNPSDDDILPRGGARSKSFRMKRR